MNMQSNISGITARIEEISPEQAQVYLAKSKGNRALKRAKVDSLKRDILAGNFRLNGESIIFSNCGVLVDGHHRLSASVDSGIPIESVVVRGIEVDAKKTIDTGASRTIGDQLSIDGFKNSNHISAIVNVLFSLRNGRPRSSNMSSSEVYDFVGRYPEIHDAASFASTKAYSRLANVFGAIFFVAIRQSEEWKAENFRSVFATGVPDYPGCPAHLLRERLNSDAIRGRKIQTAELQRLTIAAWEKFRVGTPVKTLKSPATFKITGWPCK